jgi:hypothetical protein
MLLNFLFFIRDIALSCFEFASMFGVGFGFFVCVCVCVCVYVLQRELSDEIA